MLANGRPVLRGAEAAVRVEGSWFMSSDSPDPGGDPLALRWRAGPALATARLIPHEGGVVVQCQLDNLATRPVAFNGWRPMIIDRAHGGALFVGDEPWRASVLINGYQSWDYAGIHPLDDAVKDPGQPVPHHSWWTCAIYGRDRDAMFVAQVLRASRFATVFHWRYHRDEAPGTGLPTAITTWSAEQDGAPLSQPEQRSGLPEALQLEVAAGTGLHSDPILLLYGEDGTATLKRALRLAGDASGRRTVQDPPRGWCSWYHFGLAVTDADVRRHAAFLSRRLPQLARTAPKRQRTVIELDDGWMPRWQRWGDWVTNEFFAEGLGSLAQAIRRRRLEAGIWVAPFLVAGDSALAAAHPEWLVRDALGGLLTDPRLTQPYHVLDVTHPQALAFLETLFRGLRGDGFSYFKLDFLYAGAYEGRRQDPRVTGTEALRIGLKRIVDAVNPPGRTARAYVLACGAPLMPVVGLVQACRIGGDVATPQMVDGKATPPFVGYPLVLSRARNQAARVFFDRTLFANDADVVMVTAPQLTRDEARIVVTLVALSGGLFLTSDDLESLPPDRLALLRNPNLLALAGGPAAEPLHLFSAPELEAPDHWYAFPQELPPVWVRPEPHRPIVAVFNWSDQASPYLLRFPEAVGGSGPFQVFDLWSPRRGGRALGTRTGSLRLQLAPHSVRLLRMERAAEPPAPQR